MEPIKVKRTGKRNIGGYIYVTENGNYLTDISFTPAGETPEVLHMNSPFNDPDGEPCCPVYNFVVTNPMSEKEIREANLRSEYMMLSRLQMDCDYFLGYGGRFEGHLWAGSAVKQIEEMKRIYGKFPDDLKPEWCTWEDILKYEKEMCA